MERTNKRPRRAALLFVLGSVSLFIGAPAPAAAPQVDGSGKAFITHHEGTFGGTTLKYTSTAATILVRDDAGAPIGTFFTVAYTRDATTKTPGARPVTFLWNGGPGSSSVWLHMGAFGPRRVAIPSDGHSAGLPPYRLTDNPSSLLDVTDLVFVDPIGTGYSRATGAKGESDFASLVADADSVTRFIRTWLDVNNRNNSPKYLVGESYGSVRAAVVVHNLQNQMPGRITLNGLILLGQDLDTTETQQFPGNDMPYVIYLPTYAAAAWWHGKVSHEGRSLEQFVDSARTFARTDLAAALFLGSLISPEERTRVAARMEEFTSIPRALIEREGLRIGTAQFTRELLRSERRILIRSDLRYSVPATEAVHEIGAIGDPPGVAEALTAGRADYYRRELGIDLPMPYIVLSQGKWDYTLPDWNTQQTYHNVAPYVAQAMRANPDMRLFIGSGIFDGLAAILSAERTASHNGFPLDRVVVKDYPSGHMIFLQQDCLDMLATDLRQFFATAGTK